MRVKVRARNTRGVIRTDFGACWKTAQLERVYNAAITESIMDTLLWGSPPFARWQGHELSDSKAFMETYRKLAPRNWP